MSKCKSGYYYCYTDKKCKPISKGMRVTSRYFGNGKDPEETGIDAPLEGNGESNGNGNGGGMGEEVVHEGGSLHAWFGKSKSKDGKPGWVQSDGSPCANEPGETKTPKCYSSRRLAGLKKTKEGKKKIRSADARKSRQDPGQQQKSGGAKPTMVRTFKDKKDYKKHPSGDTKTQESMEYTTEATKDKKGAGSGTKDACYHKVKSRYSVWPSAYASGALVKCRKVGADNWGNKSESVEFSNWRDDFKATEYEFVDIIKPEPIKGVQIDEKKEETNIGGGNLGKLAAKANKRIDADVDGDVDTNDPKSSEFGEFVPSPDGKKKVKTSVKREGFSNWREELESLDEKCWKGYEKKGMKTMFGKRYPNCVKKEEIEVTKEDWQKVNKSDKTDGMSPAAVKAYRRENPGSKLKTAVTGDPKPGSKDAKRRKSFCSRSKGQQDMHNIDCSKTPDKAICKARRRWKC